MKLFQKLKADRESSLDRLDARPSTAALSALISAPLFPLCSSEFLHSHNQACSRYKVLESSEQELRADTLEQDRSRLFF